jgi:hypothetical protein
MCSTLKLYLRRGLIIHHEQTKQELSAFEDKEGVLGAPEGEFDDCVMSLAMAAVGIKKLVLKEKDERPKEPAQQIDYSKPIYPFKSIDEAAEIAASSREGRRLLKGFYIKPKEAVRG